MMQSLLLSACLVTVPALAHNSLRGASAPSQPRSLQQIDQFMLDENQVAYFVSIRCELEPDAPSNPNQQDLDDFQRLATDWVTKEVMDSVLETGSQRTSAAPFAAREFELYRFYGESGCEPTAVSYSQSHDPDPNVGGTVLVTMIFKCQFEGVDRPKDTVTFIEELEARGVATNSILRNSFRDSGAPILKKVKSVQTNGFPTTTPSWRSIGNRVRNDNFRSGYVLPFTLTWHFTTPPAYASQSDYKAMEEATTDWLERNWDAYYTESYPGSDNFARRTVDVTLEYSSFSPTDKMYTQSLTLGVEILIGANDIADVPTVNQYTTSMQLYYPTSNFTETLDTLLDEDSIFLNNTHQTSYAITPTFPVAELSGYKNQTTADSDTIDVVNYATVSITLGK